MTRAHPRARVQIRLWADVGWLRQSWSRRRGLIWHADADAPGENERTTDLAGREDLSAGSSALLSTDSAASPCDAARDPHSTVGHSREMALGADQASSRHRSRDPNRLPSPVSKPWVDRLAGPNRYGREAGWVERGRSSQIVNGLVQSTRLLWRPRVKDSLTSIRVIRVRPCDSSVPPAAGTYSLVPTWTSPPA